MDLELKGRSFLITGGTDGLGLALAKKLVDEGAQVACAGEMRVDSNRHSSCWRRVTVLQSRRH